MHKPTTFSALSFTIVLGALAAGCFSTPNVDAQIQQAQQAAAQAQQAAQSKVDGNLTVNGAPVSVTHCLSGQLMGFNGVDILGVDGSRLRLVEEVDGSETVIQLGTGKNPVTMKACGKIDVQPSPVMVNGVRVLHGTAQVDCGEGDLHVAGNVSFQCGT